MANDFVPREPRVEFYIETEEDVSGRAGTLIRHEPLADGDGALVEGAGAMYRVLYESTSGTKARLGEPIAVSGLVAFPEGPAPDDGWPVVTWAHGTVGSADICAPSMDCHVPASLEDEGLGLLRKINKAPHKLLGALLRAGWAVAMTDYEGLGTRGNHPFLLGESEGRGVLDIVPAARDLADRTDQPALSERYAIVGHSQGGQAALFAAHLASRTENPYPTQGDLVGVAALAPASNLKGGTLMDPEGLLPAYGLPDPVGDLGGFYVLFSNGVFGGNPDIPADEIFQPAAQTKYRADFDTKSRAELSLDEFWMDRPPFDPKDPDGSLFRSQVALPGSERAKAWAAYWEQVEGFTPDKQIGVPIRISQARGDQRVKATKTERLISQLRRINGPESVAEVFYGVLVGEPDPASLGDHFALLVDDGEIAAIIDWLGGLS
ncbi:pimeloyl-ACP methyl ester carboxylesterase [Catenulispora sp. GP43]|uniref:alpha/beta fold hydrolase n=1 Tax=Catenulispora sp. GP43 TaxID=3156263 RepID=UPI0035143117